MIRTIIAVLLTVILVAALAAGLWMLFSGRKGRKVSVSVVADEADPCPVSMVEVGGSTVRIYFIPSPSWRRWRRAPNPLVRFRWTRDRRT